MRFKHLQEWLDWQETLHSQKIELGLERIADVARKLDVLSPRHKVIIVAGTNGKGSVVAILESIYHQAGYRVGSYTSPHLIKYNERVKINKQNTNDESLCHAFNLIDEARGEVSLSYFEFGTLAAMQIFSQHDLDVAIYEVGLGGRLDAVNILDADLSIVTSIGIDHVQWLGSTRESIGLEKAGVYRTSKPAICGDDDPPNSLLKRAKDINANLMLINKDYSYKDVSSDSWSFSSNGLDWNDLPMPSLLGAVQVSNAATALMGLQCIDEFLPVTRDSIDKGLTSIQLPGRFQRLLSNCEVILDVAHNLDSAKELVKNLNELEPIEKTFAVFAVLADKDISGILETVKDHFDEWFISELDSDRALNIAKLSENLTLLSEKNKVHEFRSIREAYQTAKAKANASTRIVVFGSFLTVAEVLGEEV